MPNPLALIGGMLAMGAAGGAANAITEQAQQRQKTTSDMVKNMLMSGIEGGNVDFVDDPNVQKLLKSAGFPKETGMMAKNIAKIAAPGIQAAKRLKELQISKGEQDVAAGQRAARQADVTERAQSFTPGVIAPRPDVTSTTPAPGTEGAAVGARVEPTMRPATTLEMRRSIANLGVDAPTQRAILADPLVQAEFADSLQRDTQAMNKASQFALEEFKQQGRFAIEALKLGGKTHDDILKNLSVPVREEVTKMREQDKAAGGNGDIKPEMIADAQTIAAKKKEAAANDFLQQRYKLINQFAQAQGKRGLAISSAKGFISTYAKNSVALNEFQAHASKFRSLMNDLQQHMKTLTIPAKERSNLLSKPLLEMAKASQYGRTGELAAAIQGYAAVLAPLSQRLAMQAGARQAEERTKKIEESLPQITDRFGYIMDVKMHRLENEVGRIGQAYDSQRNIAEKMLVTQFGANDPIVQMFRRQEFQAIDTTLEGFGKSLENSTGATWQQLQQGGVSNVTEE